MTCAPSVSRKTLFVWSANNKSWTCLQRVLLAVRRHRIIRFFVICVTTTSVLKIVIFKNILDHGRNIDSFVLRYLYDFAHFDSDNEGFTDSDMKRGAHNLNMENLR